MFDIDIKISINSVKEVILELKNKIFSINNFFVSN